MTGDDLNKLAAEIHEANERWWRDPATGQPIIRNKSEMLMLMVSELAEAMEGERKDLMDDHLPHRKMAEVEMADCFIRIMDFAGGWGYRLGPGIPYEVEDNKAESLLQIVKVICQIDDWLHEPDKSYVEVRLDEVIKRIEDYCTKHGYDLIAAVEQKRAYNKVRHDHTFEARLAEGGKKY